MASRVTDESKWIEDSRQQFHDDSELDRIDREEAEADNIFANASDASLAQWTPEARAWRERDDVLLPVLQLNRIPVYLQHVTNAGRMNRPSIKITPGDGGTEETAEMLQARIRQIEYESDAPTAYDTMRDQQVASGRAFGRITTEENKGPTGGTVTDAIQSAFAAKLIQAINRTSLPPPIVSGLTQMIGSFVRKITPARKNRQVPRIERIEDQFTVIFGPHRKYDSSDADRVWVTRWMSKDEYIRDFGEEAYKRHQNFTDFQYRAEWVGINERSELLQIAEKWEKHFSGPVGSKECTAVTQYIFDGTQILKEVEFVLAELPIVPLWGREAVVAGVVRHYSLHNNGKSAQRLINLYVSNTAFHIAKQGKQKWLAEFGSIPSNMEDAYAANSPKSILYYLGFDPETMRPLAPPKEGGNEPQIEALAMGLQQAIELLKASMGIYDASLGQRSNETSGVAINRRKVEGEVTNYHFPGNEERTRKRIGTLLLQMIWRLDKGATSVTIRHANGDTEQVPLGTPYKHRRTGKIITHVLGDEADYGVEVESGPSYANAREQAEEAQQALIGAAPELLFTEVGVNWIRNSGRPGADEDADALARYINMKTPGLIPDKDGPQIPPQVQAQMQGLQKQLQAATGFAQQLHQQIQTKQVEQQGKLDIEKEQSAVKLEITRMQEETKRIIALATLNQEQALQKLDKELDITQDKVDRTHELHMQLQQQGHDAAQAEAQRQAAAAGQLAGQAHESQESEAAREAAAEQAQGGENGAE